MCHKLSQHSGHDLSHCSSLRRFVGHHCCLQHVHSTTLPGVNYSWELGTNLYVCVCPHHWLNVEATSLSASGSAFDLASKECLFNSFWQGKIGWNWGRHNSQTAATSNFASTCITRITSTFTCIARITSHITTCLTCTEPLWRQNRALRRECQAAGARQIWSNMHAQRATPWNSLARWKFRGNPSAISKKSCRSAGKALELFFKLREEVPATGEKGGVSTEPSGAPSGWWVWAATFWNTFESVMLFLVVHDDDNRGTEY